MEYIFITAFAVLIIALLVVFLYFQNNKIDRTYYEIKNENAAKSFRIVHLSDLHSKPFKKALKITQDLKPDVICITGDFINDHGKNRKKMLEYASSLCKTATVYYITGNHERRLDDFEELMQELSNAGFNVLLNECVHNDELNLTILGLDENQADFEDYKARKNGTFVYRDMSKFINELENSSGFRLLLSHFPENFSAVYEMNYSKYDFDLQLSGHAHGGQFCLPFIGPVFSPGQGLFPKFAKGSFGDRPKMIVSRGLGNAEFPFRLFNHPEINIIDISK